MDRKTVNTHNAPKAIGPYEQGVIIDRFLFTSGQIALDPNTGNMVEGCIEKQTIRVMENLKAVLCAGGSSFNNVVKATIYLKDLNDFEVVNRIYEKYFQGAKPARSTIQVSSLPKGALVEIDMIAYS